MTTADSLRWIKSSYSSNGGDCIEIAPVYASTTGIVPVRDSKQAGGPVLMVSAPAFAGLLTLARGAGI
ncbi:DUF397 domain-containing protein [Streptomyces yaizuensis]|uniref:DUF397 domain-containing protein n=1 Tax=Streptomyces yaizuensis TaxID=2989713 RepID=A0ABQ5P7V3_9ACTN|nr:DUF397 domain-containing protein [Streptomyces sp. YSPA8]GLF98636.1 DUF397 domain-containing protein [Streptomyces sp. YSPA8]